MQHAEANIAHIYICTYVYTFTHQSCSHAAIHHIHNSKTLAGSTKKIAFKEVGFKKIFQKNNRRVHEINFPHATL